MSEGINLVIGLGIILLLGLTIPQIASVFTDLDEVTPTGLFNTSINLIDNGIDVNIFGLSITLINFFDYLGDDIKTFFTDQIKGYYIFYESYPKIASFIFILSMMLILYAIIKALPTT